MQRVKDLDSIRGLASLAIVVYHLWLSNIGLLDVRTEVDRQLPLVDQARTYSVMTRVSDLSYGDS